MSEPACPPPEVFFDELAEGRSSALEHAKGCERCAALLEEHRQLEKDLSRLADPLPPPDFVQQVMAKVAAQPAPFKAELLVGLAVIAVAVGLGALAFLAGEGDLGKAGVAVAQALVLLRELAVAAVAGLGAVWRAAAWPLTIATAGTLLVCLWGLGRLAQVRVRS
ncbi:MAG: hypothetical protein HYZ28_04475 [Myxococcales bacterium]|nr:hypothetical protein [Myxococcales bacterium]